MPVMISARGTQETLRQQMRAFVQQLAVDLGLPCVQCCLRVREAVQGGEGLEAAARRLRYGFLREVAESRGARLIAVAHTADDQVETVLHRLLRGTGLAGLAGMPAVRMLVEGMVVVRPMLAVLRWSPGRIFQSIGQAWQEDATNSDTRYTRNLLRHELLPRLAEGPYPQFVRRFRGSPSRPGRHTKRFRRPARPCWSPTPAPPPGHGAGADESLWQPARFRC